MKNLILSILTASILGISCKKSDPPAPVPAPPVKYMSLTAASNWNYELINNTPVVTSNPFTLTSTSRDSSINGRSYHVFTNSSGSANEYYYINGNDYYNFRNLPTSLGGSSVEFIYLKDNAALAANWAQSYPVSIFGFALNITLTNTITGKGISKTVKGITYNNVIHVTTTMAVTVSGIPLPAGAIITDIQSFYAEKVGLIQSVYKVKIDYSGITENTDQQTSLVSADIK